MELLEAVRKVLEWYAEDASDNVARRAVMHDLQEAYDNAAQHRLQRTCPHCDGEVQLLERCVSCRHLQAVSR